MTVPKFHELRSRANHSLNTAQNPKKVIAVHTGIILLASLLLAFVDYLLEQQIGSTGGLSGISKRSALETAQSVLYLARSVALPFWQMGYIYYTLKVAQGADAGIPSLCEGFFRFGAVLRLKLLMAGILLLVMFASSYIASTVFMLTPWSQPLMDILMSSMNSTLDPEALMQTYESISLSVITPMMVIYAITLIILLIPVYYRYRMADLWLMDHPGCRALAALHNSRKMMRGNCVAVFKIDLHFWWFFVLDLLVSLVNYADLLFEQLGIPLPIDANIAFLLSLAVYLILQMGLYLWKQNEVSVTYAHLYEALKPRENDVSQNT